MMAERSLHTVRLTSRFLTCCCIKAQSYFYIYYSNFRDLLVCLACLRSERENTTNNGWREALKNFGSGKNSRLVRNPDDWKSGPRNTCSSSGPTRYSKPAKITSYKWQFLVKRNCSFVASLIVTLLKKIFFLKKFISKVITVLLNIITCGIVQLPSISDKK